MTPPLSASQLPCAIQLERWKSRKVFLILQSEGLKARYAIRPRLAPEFGLSPRDSYEKFIAVCDAHIAELTESSN